MSVFYHLLLRERKESWSLMTSCVYSVCQYVFIHVVMKAIIVFFWFGLDKRAQMFLSSGSLHSSLLICTVIQKSDT